MKTIRVELPDALLFQPGKSVAELEKRSRFLLALKYFELGELSSSQAAKMCDMSRAAFLTEASRLGVPVAGLTAEELKEEFGDV